jgi:hypothetical protein
MMANLKLPPETKSVIWGAIGGAVALAIVGFTWGGWVTGGTATQNAKKSAETAVIQVLAPICADKFRQQSDVTASLAELKRVGSWQQGQFIEKGGWATLPGSKADPDVARACAELLSNPKT